MQKNWRESLIHTGPSEQASIRRRQHPPSLLHQVRPLFDEVQTDGDRKPVPHPNFLGALLPHCSNVDLHKFGEQRNRMDPDGETCDHFGGPHVCQESVCDNNICNPKIHRWGRGSSHATTNKHVEIDKSRVGSF